MKENLIYTIVLLTLTLISCNHYNNEGKPDTSPDHSVRQNDSSVGVSRDDYLNPEGMTIKTRYLSPQGFNRIETEEGSFQNFLQHYPLKSYSASSLQDEKYGQHENIATSLLEPNLTQTNNSTNLSFLLSLWADYLYSKSRFDNINFTFSDGFICTYTKWAQGFRIKNKNNHWSWEKEFDKDDYSLYSFQQFMQTVLEHADWTTLINLLHPIPKTQLSAGTIILEKGDNSHAVIVMDMIEPNNPKDLFKGCGVLLAQCNTLTQENEIIKGYYDEMGLFSKTHYPDRVNYLWSPTRHKAADDKFFTASHSFEKPVFLQFKIL